MQLIDSGLSLDQKKTWPHTIVDILEENVFELKEYLKFEKIVDRKAETNVLLRIQRPYNQFETTFQQVSKEINNALLNENIVGYHCTRLLPDEINELQTNGLIPLSYDLIKSKINRLVNSRLITNDQYQALHDNNQSNNCFRKNKVCLFHTQGTFKDYWGLYKLLGIWGGESLYWYHAANKELLKRLCEIGDPCIVVCKVCSNELIVRYDLINRIINFYITKKPFEDFDSFYEHPIKAERIIKRDDDLFEKLTNYSQWKNELNT
jgi:hypothetical protein